MSVDESLLATVPFVEKFLRRSSSDDTLFLYGVSIACRRRDRATYRVRDSCEANSGDVTRRSVNSLEGPNRFRSFRLELGSEESSILLLKDAGVAPGNVREAIAGERMSEMKISKI